MPWFKIDDASHSHPKFVAAGNAAIGLFVRCGAYSAQHLTEGIVPGVIAQLYGTAPQAAKLVKVGLWHGAKHSCSRCPQPAAGDYVVHDFFEGGRNATRAQVEASRKGAAERAAKSRAARKRPGIDDETKNIHRAIGNESEPNRDGNEPHFSDSAAGQGHLSHRTGLPGVTLTQATSTPSQVLPSEVPPPPTPSVNHSTEVVAASSGRGEVEPLIQAMEHRGMRVSWTFSSEQWLELRDAVRRVGVAALVDHAERAWKAAKTQPYSARYFLAGWAGLQTTTYTGPRPITGPPSAAQSYLSEMQQIAAELRAAEGGMQ
ncbi:mucin-2 [Streptomyces roseicoloratus]|uniref:mucin-2 n=1 Tax=Streptomyces roseicoloratus TaxID=2508722 RepID=UPI00100990D8|nr:mucin-2 [Streptomyces roseicoloratus]